MADQPYADDPAFYSDEPSDDVVESYNLLPHPDDTTNQDHPDDAPLFTPKKSRKRCIGTLKIILVVILCVCMFIYLVLTRSKRSSSNRKWKQKIGDKNKNNKVVAVPYDLNFPALYPEITSGVGSECRAAWDALNSVRCHDKIFDRSRDNGTSTIRLAFGWDPMYFLPKMCTDDCKGALEGAYTNLSAKCSSDDRFNLEGYNGMFDTKFLEPGPVAAVEKLSRRLKHGCRSSPTKDSDYEFCPTEMLNRFEVIDGMNGNLDGIASFISSTDTRKIEPATRHRGTKTTNKFRYRFDYKTREQRYGPGDGETYCGWCTFDFLNRTLNAWTEGAILSPDTQQPVSLPEFIKRVTIAGKRCASSGQWEKIYDAAIARYIDTGILPADWETSMPSGDLEYLIMHGPSLGDSPVSGIHAEIERLSSPEGQKEWDNTKVPTYGPISCLSTLESVYTSAKCYINLPQEVFSIMVGQKSKKLREAYCSEDCSEVLDGVTESTSSKCRSSSQPAQVKQYFEDFETAKMQRKTFCDLLGKTSQKWDCVSALQHMNTSAWAFGHPEVAELLAGVENGLEEIKARLIPEDLREEFNKDPQMIATSPIAKNVTDRKWRIEVGDSVCAGCIWNLLAGNEPSNMKYYMKKAPSTSAYVEFVTKYHSTCTALGAGWLGGVPYGDDPVIWRVKDERGRIMRYIDAGRTGAWGKEVSGVDEATGKVEVYYKDHGGRPGIDVPSLWHVLQAERALKAEKEGILLEWEAEEEAHRRKADAEIWDTSKEWRSPTYIGPKGGFADKK